MEYDNKIFNVNGITKNQLLLTLTCALQSQYNNEMLNVKAFSIHPKKGFILYWYEVKNTNAFLFPPTIKSLTETIWDWLHSAEAKHIKCEGWDENDEHDGSNKLGFRVYCEDWGHVNNNDYALIAIKPAYIWYGK